MNFFCKGLLIALLLCFGESIAAQTNTVTSEIFYEKYAQILGKSREIPRRRIQQAEFSNTDGKRFETEIEEIDSDGGFRNLKTTKVGRKITTREMIQIDNEYYCRVNRRPWKRAEDACGEGLRLVSGSGKSTESFTIEEGKLNSTPVRLMRAYTVIEQQNTDTKKSFERFFIENKVWVSKDDLIIKREYTTGKLPDKVDFKLVESYEYNPKGLKIVKPIK